MQPASGFLVVMKSLMKKFVALPVFCESFLDMVCRMLLAICPECFNKIGKLFCMMLIMLIHISKQNIVTIFVSV